MTTGGEEWRSAFRFIFVFEGYLLNNGSPGRRCPIHYDYENVGIYIKQIRSNICNLFGNLYEISVFSLLRFEVIFSLFVMEPAKKMAATQDTLRRQRANGGRGKTLAETQGERLLCDERWIRGYVRARLPETESFLMTGFVSISIDRFTGVGILFLRSGSGLSPLVSSN